CQEVGQAVGAVADQQHTVGLEPLQRAGGVVHVLGAGADDHQARAGELGQVGGDVGAAAEVDAADAAGGHDLDAGRLGGERGGRDGGGAVQLAGDHVGQVADGHLPGRAASGQATHLLVSGAADVLAAAAP